MKKYILSKTLIVVIILLFGAYGVSSFKNDDKNFISNISNSAWWDSDWQYRKQITIDHDYVDDDLNNFPILVDHTSSDFADNAQSDGDDFVFTTDDETKLDHEIEYYNNSSGNLVAWVNIPSLSSTTDTDLYIYYGNPDCSNQENVEDVWDSNYVLVLHMNNMEDSTGYNNDAEDHSTTDAEGKIGRARDFYGNHYMVIDDDSSLDFGDGDDFTIESWIKTDDDDREMVISKYDGSNGYDTASWYTDKLMFGVKSNGGEYKDIQPSGTVNDNNWHYILGYRTSSGTIWASTDQGTLVSRNAPGSIANAYDMYIGRREDGTYQYDGVIDEIRISKIDRSDAWISTGYNNQNDSESFISVGEEETHNFPPIADFTYTPPNPIINETIYFTDNSSDLDGTLIKWLWEFGDGYSSSLQNPNYQYPDEGTYEVALTVTDDDGATDTILKSIVVIEQPNNPPDAPTITGETNGKAGMEYEYTFNSNDSDGDPVMYLIDWGDNDTEWTEYSDSGEEITLKHTWDEEGDYTLKAKAKDINEAESDWAYLEVTMPKNQNMQFGWLEQFPLLQKLIYFIGNIYD